MINERILPARREAKRKIKTWDAASFFLFLGLILLPFSNEGKEIRQAQLLVRTPWDTLGVISFGLPFLFLAIFFGFGRLAHSMGPRFSLAKYPIALGFCHLACITGSICFSADLTLSVSRCVAPIMGFSLFVWSILAATNSTFSVLARLREGIMASGTVLAIYYLVTILLLLPSQGIADLLEERGTGAGLSLPWGATNILASCLLLPLFVCLVNAVRTGLSLTSFLRLLTIGIAILMTFSRNGIICMLILITLSLFLSGNTPSAIAFICAFGITFACWMHFGPDSFSDVWSKRVTSGDLFEGLGGRGEQWSYFIEQYRRHPLPLGYYGTFSPEFGTPHNWILVVLLEQSIFGLLAAFAFFAVPFGKLISFAIKNSYSRRVSWVYICSVGTLLLNLQFEDPEFAQPYAIYFWLFFAVVYIETFVSPALGCCIPVPPLKTK